MFDTHLHVQRLRATDRYVTPCLAAAISEADWPQLRRLHDHNPQQWLALGVHPQHAHQWQKTTEDHLRRQLAGAGVVAVGEIGLDKRLAVSMEIQEQVLRCQLRLAVACDKPVVLHAVRSFDKLIPMLEQERIDRVGGVVHGFYGSVEIARQLERLNLAVGVGRLILDPAAKKLVDVVRAVSEDSLLIETDAPWRQPCGDWGLAWNQILDQVARLRDWDRHQAIRITDENARRILRVPHGETR
ncbi:TatD family hydrolase [Desulfuromonas acetoxidans]|uniref:TatD-related deoxyribonuclease n=1 Tax=Desulfuromonas acetoxidans (strain DSM 684 / 11070) TaxID=281689 RepID=Q1JXP5_DESA6|nr:TatD family hydrolase [Desulfuromonas acetoxidans]EAT15098.1 TatD-related deoxyribonuclease [Desulfuromonas acetoxidans DSM 684]MBF0645471.1 TatD family hydrolase [Desulfuromonas acetoxidans]NVD25328.1 TatD family hydrolase [Desulfuromonas acetoxidans]NVE17380.1 TatD family hydrolase [Desulfuromonas acetoxidans]